MSFLLGFLAGAAVTFTALLIAGRAHAGKSRARARDAPANSLERVGETIVASLKREGK